MREFLPPLFVRRAGVHVAQQCARLGCFSRFSNEWDESIAAHVGEKLGLRLKVVGASAVEIDLTEELSRPPHYRCPLASLFGSIQRAGIHVDDAEKLKWPSRPSRQQRTVSKEKEAADDAGRGRRGDGGEEAVMK